MSLKKSYSYQIALHVCEVKCRLLPPFLRNKPRNGEDYRLLSKHSPPYHIKKFDPDSEKEFGNAFHTLTLLTQSVV
jgi:hypothetical protein